MDNKCRAKISSDKVEGWINLLSKQGMPVARKLAVNPTEASPLAGWPKLQMDMPPVDIGKIRPEAPVRATAVAHEQDA